MKVTSHRQSWDGIHGLVDLRPGVNEVDPDVWAKVAKDPAINERIARGEYVVEAPKPAPAAVAPAVTPETKEAAPATPEPPAEPVVETKPEPATVIESDPVVETKSRAKAKPDKPSDEKKPGRSRGKRS